MLIAIEKKKFKDYFNNDPHSFITTPFFDLNKSKIEKLVYLIVDNDKKVSLGLVVGIKNKKLLSPFSAPFGGFHFRNDKIYISEIDEFLISLKKYINKNELSGFKITLPPNIYHQSFNAKMINSLIRNGFKMAIPEITNYVDLKSFSGTFTDRNSRNYFNQAVKNELAFEMVTNFYDKEKVFDLIVENRQKFGRPIYMTIEDVLRTSRLWKTDFFKVIDKDNNLVASAIYYRFDYKISYAVFWGDNDLGRPLRAMDFLAYNLWNFYKKLDYEIIDLGTSTESGLPNEGLLRFKETHNCISSLRFSFEW